MIPKLPRFGFQARAVYLEAVTVIFAQKGFRRLAADGIASA